MFSFCRKVSLALLLSQEKNCMSISSSIVEKLQREGFLQETHFLWHKLVFLHCHSVTSEMTSQYFPPFENEKFKAWFLFTLENGQLQQQLFPQRKMPRSWFPQVASEGTPPTSMEDEAAPSFVQYLQVARGRKRQSVRSSFYLRTMKET